MILIIGGAYQGKLDYALEHFKNKKVFNCSEVLADVDFSADILNGFHKLVLAQVRTGADTAVWLKEALPRLRDKVIISDDISCGVVPISAELRLWREVTGRVLAALSAEAESVIRIFCGLEVRLK